MKKRVRDQEQVLREQPCDAFKRKRASVVPGIKKPVPADLVSAVACFLCSGWFRGNMFFS